MQRGRSASANTQRDGEIKVGNFSRPGFGRNLSHVPENQPKDPPRPSSQRRGAESRSHRRQHSQGYFEPSLPSSSLLDTATASQIAAQTAMHYPQIHQRQRSLTTSTLTPPSAPTIRKVPQPIQTSYQDVSRRPGEPPTPRATSSSSTGGAAASAASTAYPGRISPALEKPPEKEHRLRSERSRINFFGKAKPALPSPNKIASGQVSALSRIVSPSMTSLADSFVSNSTYSLRNDSTSTLVPSSRTEEKAHRPHFLSRQKNKLRDRLGDDHQLSLASAMSSSRAPDPPPLYSFAASPASPAGTFFTGLHPTGRASKKKDDRAGLPFAPKISDIDRLDLGDGRATSATHGSEALLQGFGLQGMRPEDAWDFLKAKLLVLFDGEDLRIPVEDLNRLVNVHIQWCVSQRGSLDVWEDFRLLLRMGFQALDGTLRDILEQRIVLHLVEMWLFVFGSILPIFQAVFLPFDLEFRRAGHGENDVRRMVLLVYRDTVILPRYETLKMTFSRLSLESINAASSPVKTSFDPESPVRPSTANSTASPRSLGSSLLNDVSFSPTSRSRGNSTRSDLPPNIKSGHSKKTSHDGVSLSTSSSASGLTLPARNISFRPTMQRRTTTTDEPPDTSHVTETVGRMLQCVSVLASVQSGDGDQSKVEDLARSIKLNWLGRGRVGRIRRGFVGAKSQAPSKEGNAYGGQLGAGAGGLGGASML